MTEDQAIELARSTATRTADWPYHEYQPTPEVVRAVLAAVAQEQERIKAALLEMHKSSAMQHNYYQHAAVALFAA